MHCGLCCDGFKFYCDLSFSGCSVRLALLWVTLLWVWARPLCVNCCFAFRVDVEDLLFAVLVSY